MVTDCHDRNYTYKVVGRILQMDDFVKLFLGFYKQKIMVIDSSHNDDFSYQTVLMILMSLTDDVRVDEQDFENVTI